MVRTGIQHYLLVLRRCLSFLGQSGRSQRAQNYAAALRAGDGYRHDVDGAGAKHLAVSDTTGLAGAVGGFIPNANALIATQIPRQKSGWALGTLSTGAVSGALLGPLAGGFLADHWGLRTVFFLTASVLLVCFILTLFFIREQFVPVAKKEMLNARDVFSSLKSPKLVLSLFVTTMIIQVATGSIAPILTLYVRDLAGDVGNIAFISGMIASVPGVAALISAPRLGKLGDRIGPEKSLSSR